MQVKVAEQSLEVTPRGFAGYAATFNEVDRVGDVILPGAFVDAEQFIEKGGVILYQHTPEPVAKPVQIVQDAKGLWVEAQFGRTAKAIEVAQMVKDGLLSRMSIGYDVLESEVVSDFEIEKRLGRPLTKTERDSVKRANGMVNLLKQLRLFEISLVSVPANTSARVVEVKAVTGYQSNIPLAPRDYEWDSRAAERRVRQWAGAEDAPNARYARAFFWHDSDAPENFTSYKLPYCDVIDGELHAVPRGIFAAAAVLSGARGGVDIPEEDQRRIRRVVSRWYARMRDEFDDDSIVPPWEREKSVDVVRITELEQELMRLKDKQEALERFLSALTQAILDRGGR